ncbi:MAG: hypothetical protein HWN65_01570 [Candidatus Helarchaeota archaeon]|nr:hypothetical protein [Candidatus Helarchaeota archaeon]
MEKHPGDRDKTLKPIPRPTPLPKPRFQVGDIVQYKNDDHLTYEIRSIEPIERGFCYWFALTKSGGSLAFSVTFDQEENPEDDYELVKSKVPKCGACRNLDACGSLSKIDEEKCKCSDFKSSNFKSKQQKITGFM